jgi:hypothetical protein
LDCIAAVLSGQLAAQVLAKCCAAGDTPGISPEERSRLHTELLLFFISQLPSNSESVRVQAQECLQHLAELKGVDVKVRGPNATHLHIGALRETES